MELWDVLMKRCLPHSPARNMAFHTSISNQKHLHLRSHSSTCSRILASKVGTESVDFPFSLQGTDTYPTLGKPDMYGYVSSLEGFLVFPNHKI